MKLFRKKSKRYYEAVGYSDGSWEVNLVINNRRIDLERGKLDTKPVYPMREALLHAGHIASKYRDDTIERKMEASEKKTLIYEI